MKNKVLLLIWSPPSLFHHHHHNLRLVCVFFCVHFALCPRSLWKKASRLKDKMLAKVSQSIGTYDAANAWEEITMNAPNGTSISLLSFVHHIELLKIDSTNGTITQCTNTHTPREWKSGQNVRKSTTNTSWQIQLQMCKHVCSPSMEHGLSQSEWSKNT